MPIVSQTFIFEYSANQPKKIWSIQLYDSQNNLCSDFKNLTMGCSKEKVVKEIGYPDNIININEYGFRWEYLNTNYTLEINLEGKLTSIKITNNN